MNNIAKDIKTGEFKKVYLLYGPEDYLKKQFAEKIMTAVCPEESMNRTVLSGESIDVNELTDICNTMPFFAEKRVVMVYGSGFFRARSGEGKESGSSAKEKLLELVNDLPETTVLVFVENKDKEKDGRKTSEVDKRSKLYKAVTSNGYASEFTTPPPADLRTWIAANFKKYDKNITAQTADYLVSYVGNDMQVIKNEIEKLCFYAYERDSVTIQDIDSLCIKALSAKIFDMTDSMVEGKKKKALEIYETLIAMREPVQMIFYMLLRHYTQLFVAAEMYAGGASFSEIMGPLKCQDFVAKKLIAQSRKYTLSGIRDMIEYGVTLEEDYKNGRVSPDMITELFIMHEPKEKRT